MSANETTELASPLNRSRPRRGVQFFSLLIGMAIVAAILFFALGGDVDFDTRPGRVDAPALDVDVAPPSVDVDPPSIDLDPGSIDVHEGDAEADAR